MRLLQRRRSILATVVAVAMVVGGLAAVTTPVAGQSSGEVKTITATVETEDGEPVSGATVTATWNDGETSADTAGNGKVFMDVPVGATVSFDVDHPEYTRNFALRRTISSDTDEVTVEVSSAVTFSYRVQDTRGDSVEDVRVAVVDTAGREIAAGQTGTDGRFSSRQIEAGSYTVRLTKPGYLTVERSEDADVSVTRQVEMERGNVVLAVDVRDPRADEDVAGAQVAVQDKTAETDDTGRATVSLPVNTEVRVEVTRQGYGDAARTVSVGESDQTVQVNLARLPSLTVESANQRVLTGETTVVTVTDAYGDPATNATVLLDGEEVATTDEDGEVLVPVDSAGDHEIRAQRNGVTSNVVTIEGVQEAQATTGGTSTAAVQTPAGDDGGFPSFGAAPGFGVVAALIALLSLAYVARVSRR